MRSLSHFLLSTVLLTCGVLGEISVETRDATFEPDQTLRVTTANINNGCIERQSVLVNGTSPGPELRLAPGKVWSIRVWNDMTTDNLTMHWHGIPQTEVPFSDGTPSASQWPIPPSHFFDYEVDLRNVTGGGTYFYHSHVGFQAVTAAGPLIVEDSEKCPFVMDFERTIFLGDVFNSTDSKIEKGLAANPFVWSGETNALLFNGVGMTGNTASTSGPGCGIATIDVEPDKIYRLRFIGGTALSYSTIAIESHPSLAIIEADGEYTKPHNVSFLQVGTGQRYSTLIHTKNCSELAASSNKLQYYIQSQTNQRPTLTRGFAILNYANTCNFPPSNTTLSTSSPPSTAPLTLPTTVEGYLDYELRPLTPNNFINASEVTRRVTINTQQITTGYSIWQDNMYNWTTTSTPIPYAVALYENATHFLPNYTLALSHGGIDPTVGAWPARVGEVLELVIQADGSNGGGLDVHPFHLHGRHFYDIGSGQGAYDAAANEARLVGTAPVLRDTTLLDRYSNTTGVAQVASWRAWRVRVETPGVFMMHCHILQHMLMGMQMVWVFGDAEEIRAYPVEDVADYLKYGGNVYGNASYVPPRRR